MVTDVKPLQFSNADSLIEVTLFGMVTDVKPLQFQSALSPIEVTLYVVPFWVIVDGMTRLPLT